MPTCTSSLNSMTISGRLFPVEDDANDEHHVPDIDLAGAVEVGILCEKPRWRVAEDGGHGSRHVFDAHHPVVVHVAVYRLHLLHVDVEPLGGVYLLAVVNGELHVADINGSSAERQVSSAMKVSLTNSYSPLWKAFIDRSIPMTNALSW